MDAGGRAASAIEGGLEGLHRTGLNVELRPMTRDDIPLGMRLKELAGWNQTPADWEMLMSAGSGLVAVLDGTAAGTATVVGYGEVFAWVGMVLVDPVFRQRGIGTALLQAAIALGQRQGAVRLDATPQGEPLYRRLGFEAEYGLIRMRRPGRLLPVPTDPGLSPEGCRALVPEAMPEIAGYDAPVFGAWRTPILKALRLNAPRYAVYATGSNCVAGYCLGREGSDYDQVGPVVAEELGVAQALLLAALRNAGQRDVILDVPTGCVEWIEFLHSLGFVRQRPFTRMCLGGGSPFGQPEKQFAIAGPEIG